MRGHEVIAFSGIQYAKYLLPLREAGRKRIGASRGDALLIMYVCEFSYILRMYTYIHTIQYKRIYKDMYLHSSIILAEVEVVSPRLGAGVLHHHRIEHQPADWIGRVAQYHFPYTQIHTYIHTYLYSKYASKTNISFMHTHTNTYIHTYTTSWTAFGIFNVNISEHDVLPGLEPGHDALGSVRVRPQKGAGLTGLLGWPDPHLYIHTYMLRNSKILNWPVQKCTVCMYVCMYECMYKGNK